VDPEPSWTLWCEDVVLIRIASVPYFCEYGNEPVGFLKGESFYISLTIN
jgi:hypothetical protein